MHLVLCDKLWLVDVDNLSGRTQLGDGLNSCMMFVDLASSCAKSFCDHCVFVMRYAIHGHVLVYLYSGTLLGYHATDGIMSHLYWLFQA